MKHIGRKTFGISVGIVAVLLLGVVTVWGASYVADTFTNETKIALKEDVTVHTDVGQVSLTLWECGSAYTDSRDGKVYSTVQIGDQCWMAENMNIRITGEIAKYCHSNNESNCDNYGGLYPQAGMLQGAAACNGTGEPPNDACATPVQGICPDGWHIPSDYEWITLGREVCESGTCETDFPYAEQNMWASTEGLFVKAGGTSGFEFLLGGYRHSNGTFSPLGGNGYIWTSSERSGSPVRWMIYSSDDSLRSGTDSALHSYSVRCLQN